VVVATHISSCGVAALANVLASDTGVWPCCLDRFAGCLRIALVLRIPLSMLLSLIDITAPMPLYMYSLIPTHMQLPVTTEPHTTELQVYRTCSQLFSMI
jgi:hypothetical protein